MSNENFPRCGWLVAALMVAACQESRPGGILDSGVAGATTGMGGKGTGGSLGTGGGLGTGGSVSSGGAVGTAGSSVGGSSGGQGGGATTPTGGQAPADTGGGGAGGTTGGRGGSAATGAGGSAAASGAGGSNANGGAGGEELNCNTLRIPLDHPISATTYTPTADTITDGATGLMWQRNIDPTFQTSFRSARCPTALGGFTDWRPPTVLELATIVDFGAQNPTISLAAFPGTPASFFFTSTPLFMSTLTEWTIDFKSGLTVNGSSSGGYLRCVRPAGEKVCFSGPRFLVDSKASASVGVEVVIDRQSGVPWERGSPPVLSWAEAKARCTSLNVRSRLPTAKELLSLVDFSKLSAIDVDVFSDTLKGDYWTSTMAPGSTSNAITVSFGNATYSGTHATPTTEAHLVRCVVNP